ncbi:MAG: tRNA uridine-5-carboxymethylaminomethyl(34) synthesis GTPase MnmE [Clostridia bacterium]|nr:tRNA uridine-5-carboxymethylaminomethyl(34) synthesis GTPase MnmE [Clostridia bacterium]
MDNRTIAAISTPQGVGGIAVIRISGENAIGIADKVFKGKISLLNAQSHTIHYGKIISDNKIIDEVLVTVMRAPKTFTREDVVEISTHGGFVASRLVLDALFAAGAVPALAGEFTKRAFMSGRIDLSQAEAVIDIINAKTDLAQKNALSQAGGHLTKRIDGIRSSLVSLAAAMQVSIDYPDEDLEDMTIDEISETLKKAFADITALSNTASRGRLLKNGIRTAIIGRPNVGKSSLLNYLAMEERAIVTDIAGTTRDVIEESVDLDGVPLILLDTAGIRSTADVVEKIGVERSLKYIDEAELVLLVLDAKEGLTAQDVDLLDKTANVKRIVLINKTDDAESFEFDGAIRISALTGAGIPELSSRIKEMYNLGVIGENEVTITNERQVAALLRAKAAVERAINALSEGIAQDFAALDINEALDALGEIDGRTVSEDIVSDIFKGFCVGK